MVVSRCRWEGRLPHPRETGGAASAGHEVGTKVPAAQRPTRAYFDLQALRLARPLPELALARQVRGLSALDDVSPDWNPLLDETPLPGLLVTCGTSGNSVKTAPALGQPVATLVDAHLRGTRHPRRCGDPPAPR